MRILGGQKYCPKCRNYKPIEAYGKDSWQKDSLHTHCRVCRRTYRLARKPIPTIAVHVNTNYPRRLHVPQARWYEFDILVEGGYKVDIIKPNLEVVDWGELE